MVITGFLQRKAPKDFAKGAGVELLVFVAAKL